MSKKDLIQLGITGVLVVVLILAMSNASKKAQLRKSKNALTKPVSLSAVAVNQVKSQPDSGNLYNSLEQQAKSIELKRDPFTAAPIVSEKILQAGVDLTGILWDKDKPLAIIDGNIVKKGASIGSKTVVDIKKDRVILSDGKELTELRLEE
ncbi:MAG: hypothetical protein PHU59_02805 [Candidatus Omnitrophica bacterium]|nr:hypothetical protein [Candidatus Omnitrophota bacterium]